MRRHLSIAVTTILVFLAFIYLPFLGGLPGVHEVNKGRFLDMEQREPNEYPPLELSVEELRHFPDAFEKAFNDRFGFRRDLITLYKLFMYKVFDVSTDQGNVVVGRDGWMFLGDKYEDVFSRHTGMKKPDETEVRTLITSEIQKWRWFNRRGIAYLFAVAPDKHSVYPEYLPDYVVHANELTLLDRLNAANAALGLPILDLRPSQLRSKRDYGDSVYAKTDSHWSYLGTYEGYRAIMKKLEEQTGPLKSVAMTGFRRSTGRAYNLEGLLGLRKHYKMKDEHITLDLDSAAPAMTARSNGADTAPWPEDKEVHYNERLVVNNPDALNKLRVFALRDSFSNRLSVLLNRTFSTVFYTHYNRISQRTGIVQLLLDFKPDVLLFEMVERNLAGVKDVYPPWQNDLTNPVEGSRLWKGLRPVAEHPGLKPGQSVVLNLPGGEKDILVRYTPAVPASIEYATLNNAAFRIAEPQPAGLVQGAYAYSEIRASSGITKLRLTSLGTSGVAKIESISVRAMSDTALKALYH